MDVDKDLEKNHISSNARYVRRVIKGDVFAYAINAEIPCDDSCEFGTALAYSVESDIRCQSRVYIDNVMLTSQKPYQDNNKSVIAAKQTVINFIALVIFY